MGFLESSFGNVVASRVSKEVEEIQKGEHVVDTEGWFKPVHADVWQSIKGETMRASDFEEKLQNQHSRTIFFATYKGNYYRWTSRWTSRSSGFDELVVLVPRFGNAAPPAEFAEVDDDDLRIEVIDHADWVFRAVYEEGP